MRKLLSLLLILLLCGCGIQAPPTASSAGSAALPVALESGAWPDHSLAEGIAQPESGRIGGVWVTADESALSITVEELDHDGLTDYLELLNSLGFTTLAFTREKGTTCGLLADGERALSFTHLEDSRQLSLGVTKDNS